MKKVYKLLLCLFISSLNFNMILKPLHLVTGGTQGLALIIANLIKISPALVILIINLIFFVISYLFLNKTTTKSIMISTFVYPIFIKITSLIPCFFNKTIILIILSGVISGFTIGNILKLGYSTGGINILLILFKKYFQIEEFISNFFLNTIIIIGGIYIFGLKKAIYSLIIIVINSLIIKKILHNNVIIS